MFIAMALMGKAVTWTQNVKFQKSESFERTSLSQQPD